MHWTILLFSIAIMKLSASMSRQKRNKHDAGHALNSPKGRRKSTVPIASPERENTNQNAEDIQDNSPGNQPSSRAPATPPKSNRLEPEAPDKDPVPTSPKRSLSTIMASVKQATTWTEITTTAIKVPTVARIVWLANRGRWLALDQLLEKLFLEDAQPIDLNIEASLLGVCTSRLRLDHPQLSCDSFSSRCSFEFLCFVIVRRVTFTMH